MTDYIDLNEIATSDAKEIEFNTFVLPLMMKLGNVEDAFFYMFPWQSVDLHDEPMVQIGKHSALKRLQVWTTKTKKNGSSDYGALDLYVGNQFPQRNEVIKALGLNDSKPLKGVEKRFRITLSQLIALADFYNVNSKEETETEETERSVAI